MLFRRGGDGGGRRGFGRFMWARAAALGTGLKGFRTYLLALLLLGISALNLRLTQRRESA